MFSFNQYLFFSLSYLIGSIPFGIIIARLAGIGDITKQGSGNIGATNVARIGGKKLGAATFVLDMLKSFVPATIYMYSFADTTGALICAFMATIGHILPIFNKFKGGKGVATGFGALLAINPLIFCATGLIWISCFVTTKISSASALLAFALMPFMFMFATQDTSIMGFAIALSIVIYVRHIENIKRLLNGEEKALKKAQ